MGIPVIEPYAMPAQVDLPATRLPWQLDPARAIVLVHDMQSYFLSFFPRDRPPVTDLLRNVASIRRAAKAAGMPLVYTAQPGGMTRAERGLLHDVWGPGMDADPENRQIPAEIAPGDGDTVLTKWRYSAFVRSPLDELLARLGRDQMVICGIYAHVGCLITASDAFSRDVQPFLVADAIADFTSDYHRMALTWAAERCAAITVTDEVLEAITSGQRRLSA